MASPVQGGPVYFAGQLVKVQIDGINKSCVRRAVITHVTTTGVEVVYGQSTTWGVCGCPFFVTRGSLLGRRLELTKDTYFCDAQVVPLHYISRILPDVCPASAFQSMEAVANDTRLRQARARAAQQAAAQRTASVQGDTPQPAQPTQQAQQQQQVRQQPQTQPGKQEPPSDTGSGS
jgi:hypothetical protein